MTRQIVGSVAWALSTAWFALVAGIDRVLACAPWRWGQ